jgi:ring-1,2-phenylacetyl-CoA epoxidase subunit PaaE
MPGARTIAASSVPTTPIPPEATSVGMSPRFHRLTVADVRRETHDAVSIAFAVPPHLAADYRFSAGQYLTIRTTLEGEEVRRSYSLCCGPDDGELRIAVKRVMGGLFSSWINAGLKVGDELDVMTPTGRFGLSNSPGDGCIHVAFAAGSGITPVLSILRGVLTREPHSRFFLFYGNRSTGDMLFHEDLEDLKDRFLNRLSLFYVLSQEEQDLAVLNGRLDGEKARLLLRTLVPAAALDHVFICGPSGMIDDLQAALSSIGLAQEKIHVERFVSAFEGRPREKPQIVPEAAPTHMASLIVDGKRRDIPVAKGEAILDAALRAGIDLPFACRGGMCCTCRAKVVEGATEMNVNYSLEPWELAAGFVLTCQAHPTSARVVVDFDQM